jgi:hypothetical protein
VSPHPPGGLGKAGYIFYTERRRYIKERGKEGEIPAVVHCKDTIPKI